MYPNNPYGPYMQGDMYSMPRPEYMYGAGNSMPEYMTMGMPMANPMMNPMMNPMANPVMPMEYPSKPYYMENKMPFKEKKCVKVPEVIGRNHCNLLLEQDIPFPPTHPAFEIKDVTKDVKDLILQVCRDKVLINGKLHKNINYKTLETCCKHPCHCEEIDIAYGDLRHAHVVIPFNAYIEVPGARPGDNVEIEFAGVEDDCELDILMDPCFVKGCEMPVYKKVREKVLVKIDLKVLRPVQVTIDPDLPNICP